MCKSQRRRYDGDMERLYLDNFEVGPGGGLPIAGGIISTDGELMWTNPVRPGDMLRVECEVLEITPDRACPLSAFICGSILVVHRGDS